MPSSDGGDQDDRERFQVLCDQLNRDPNVSIDADDVWKKAQESVLEDLENPEFVQFIKDQARELQSDLGLGILGNA